MLRPHHLHRVRRLRVVTFATFALFSRAAAPPVFGKIRKRKVRERFLEANKKCVTQSDLRSAACRLPAGAGVGTVAEMVFEGVEYVIRLASGAGAA